MIKKTMAIFLALLMLIIPCLMNAQTSTEIIQQARMDAQRDINGCLWMGLGFFLVYLAVGAAYILVPNPPPSRLMGKSPEYVQVYILAYRRQARSKQVTNSLAGCLGIFAAAFIVVIIQKIATQD